MLFTLFSLRGIICTINKYNNTPDKECNSYKESQNNKRIYNRRKNLKNKYLRFWKFASSVCRGVQQVHINRCEYINVLNQVLVSLIDFVLGHLFHLYPRNFE